jgi:alanine dehydrogenase
MQIVIAKNIQTGLHDIFITNGAGMDLKVDDIGFSSVGIEEAKSRAATLRVALACPVVRGDCDDYLLFRECEIG